MCAALMDGGPGNCLQKEDLIACNNPRWKKVAQQDKRKSCMGGKVGRGVEEGSGGGVEESRGVERGRGRKK